MKKILVTGGAGFIGSHTVVELYSAGYEPVILDDFSNSNEKVLDGIEQITGQKPKLYKNDFADSEALEKILVNEKIEGIIHFAAFKQVNESVNNPLKYYQNNVAGLVSLLNIMERCKIKPLVFSSSCVIYGEPDTLPVTEDSPIKPAVSPYGTTKQMGESIIKDTVSASDTMSALALRYFNPIGAHPSGKIGELPIGVPANLIPLVTQAAAGLRPELTVYGDQYPTTDGTCIRDYIHVVDLAKAHIKALEYTDKQTRKSYEVVNVGTGKGSSVLEVLNTFQEVTGVKVPYKIGPNREGDVISSYASVDKATKVLGWKSEKTLADALADAWNWQQQLTKVDQK